MHAGKCFCGFCAGIVLLGAAEETQALGRAIECLIKPDPVVNDFGPPEGCNDQQQQHPRSNYLTTTSQSTGTGAVLSVVTAINVIADLDHFRMDAPLPPFSANLVSAKLTMPSTGWHPVLNDRGERVAYFHISAWPSPSS